MKIPVTCWAVSRAHAQAMLEGLGIVRVLQNGDWEPIVSAHIFPTKYNKLLRVEYFTGNMGEDAAGNLIEEKSVREGFPFDIIYYGKTAESLTKPEPSGGWPQDASLFDRTLILEMVEARTGVAPSWVVTNPPVPPGYEAGGVRVFDPALISSRSHGWA